MLGDGTIIILLFHSLITYYHANKYIAISALLVMFFFGVEKSLLVVSINPIIIALLLLFLILVFSALYALHQPYKKRT